MPDDHDGNRSAADDLRSIRGIGAEAERGLHAAGIWTFVDLASRSSAEIAVATRMARQRIEREDWVGQARRQAERRSAVTTPDKATAGPEPEPEPDGEHYESFVLRLALGPDDVVLRTSVQRATPSDCPAGQQASWPGWDGARLVAFLADHAVRVPPPEPLTPEPLTPESSSPQPPEPEPPPAARPQTDLPDVPNVPAVRVREVLLVPAGATSASQAVPAGAPFAVRIALDVQGIDAGRPLHYRLGVTARQVGASPASTTPVGAETGTVALTSGAVRVELAGRGLPEGLYRLRGALRLYDGPVSTRPRRLVDIDGGLLDVTAR